MNLVFVIVLRWIEADYIGKKEKNTNRLIVSFTKK